MSIANEITRLREAKDDLKTSINAKNTSSNQITNETIDDYASFVDLIPQSGIIPTGTINITSNGTHDVTNYASADVNVPGIIPTGTINITENGTYDVTNYASANVDVKNGSSTAPYVLDSVSWSGHITGSSGDSTSTRIYVSPTATEITTRIRDGRTEYLVPNGIYFIMITGKLTNYSTDTATQITFPPGGGTQMNYIAASGQIRFLSAPFTINQSSEKQIEGSTRSSGGADVVYTLYRLNDTYHT